MKKSAGVIAATLAIGAIGVVPASAGQSNVAPGSVYKGEYTWMGMADNFRIKTFSSGKSGNFSLRCAGIQRERISIKNGEFKLKAGADAVLVKGSGKFKKNGVIEGEITMISTDGAECAAPGEFAGVIADV